MLGVPREGVKAALHIQPSAPQQARGEACLAPTLESSKTVRVRSKSRSETKRPTASHGMHPLGLISPEIGKTEIFPALGHALWNGLESGARAISQARAARC